jgi:hypothetical protein
MRHTSRRAGHRCGSSPSSPMPPRSARSWTISVNLPLRHRSSPPVALPDGTGRRRRRRIRAVGTTSCRSAAPFTTTIKVSRTCVYGRFHPLEAILTAAKGLDALAGRADTGFPSPRPELEPEAREDPLVGSIHLLIGLGQRVLVEAERVGVLHHEVARASPRTGPLDHRQSHLVPVKAAARRSSSGRPWPPRPRCQSRPYWS